MYKWDNSSYPVTEVSEISCKNVIDWWWMSVETDRVLEAINISNGTILRWSQNIFQVFSESNLPGISRFSPDELSPALVFPRFLLSLFLLMVLF